jgi:predicted  nucleic acid-binding Zn-ribbon protein
MKKIVLIVSLLFCGYFVSDVSAKNDTTQAMKTRLEKVEKQVDQLQAEVKTLRAAESKKTSPVRARKMVIDRRGTKQVYLQ